MQQDVNVVYELEAYVIELQNENAQLTRQVECLKARNKELETHILMEDVKTAGKRSQSAKMQYYHAHKTDPDIVEQLEKRLNKAGLPNYRAPWYWVKQLTDAAYEKEHAT